MRFWLSVLAFLKIFCLASCFDLFAASDYQLNPFQMPLTGSNSLLKKADHDQWIHHIYSQISLRSIVDRKSVRDDQDINIGDKLRSAADEYLQLQPQRTIESAQEAIEIISNANPYSEITQDLAESLSLLWLSGSTDIPLMSGFCNKDEFLNRLPVKLKTQAVEKCAQVPQVAFNPRPGYFKIEIVGIEKIPAKLRTGRYLLHELRDGYLTGYWLDVSEKEIAWTQIWKRNIWTAISLEKLRSYISTAKPKQLPNREVSLITPDQPAPILILSQTRPITKTPFSAFDTPFEPEVSDQIQTELPIFKNPWFWIVSASLAGLAGYTIYESTHTREVKTP